MFQSIIKLNFILTLLVMIFSSCGNQDPKEQIQRLTGYWQISQVEMPNGNLKNYKSTNNLDYIEIKDSTGFRIKVEPKIDGSFTTSGVTELFVLRIEEDSLRIYYTTPYDSWKETIISAKDSILKIKNKDNKIFTYHRFRKFDF